MARVV